VTFCSLLNFFRVISLNWPLISSQVVWVRRVTSFNSMCVTSGRTLQSLLQLRHCRHQHICAIHDQKEGLISECSVFFPITGDRTIILGKWKNLAPPEKSHKPRWKPRKRLANFTVW
jgi:hypothetical protein